MNLNPLLWKSHYTRQLVMGGLVFIAYFAAINRAQTLPWAIAALLCATLIVGISLPHLFVRHLSATRNGPQCAQEGDAITLRVEIKNHGLLPRFMVELVDRLPFVGAADGVVSQGEESLGVVAYVPGGGTRSFDVSLVCEKRGFYRLGPVAMMSSFPLGLVEVRQSRNEGVQTLTIYPNLFTIVALPLHGAPSQIHRGGYLLPEGAGAAEFSGLREYRRGDNPRHVHWPTTARRNELMVREFEPLASACLYLVLDQARDTNVGRGKQSSFELAVRIAGSIAKYATDNNIPTRLMGQGQRSLFIKAGTGEHHYRGMLDELAVVAADGVTPYAEVLAQVALECLTGETVVVFLSESSSRLTNTLQALALLRARGANLFAMVFERESFDPKEKAGAFSEDASAMAGLIDLGAYCLPIGRGSDLVKLFNS